MRDRNQYFSTIDGEYLGEVVNVKHEECDVLIDRNTKWGNPYVIGKDGDRDEVIAKYKAMITKKDPFILLQIYTKFKGKKLGCHCSPNKCHGDVLMELLQRFDNFEKQRIE